LSEINLLNIVTCTKQHYTHTATDEKPKVKPTCLSHVDVTVTAAYT